MEETAYAKLNLALHVRARESDGYHRIETIFAFAEDGDALRAEPADEISLQVEGPFASALGPDNLVLRAADALRNRFGVVEGARLTLEKRLPVAAGIGGGSADAAAAIRLLCRLWRIEAEEANLLALAATLGADVPACLLSRTMRGDGRGDRLMPADSVTGTPVVLVNPGVAVSTAAVFRGWDGIDRGPLNDPRDGRNDLEAPARATAPMIGEVLELLGAAFGATLVRMSGSGATCFALFDDAASRDAADAAIASARPDWWRLASRLR